MLLRYDDPARTAEQTRKIRALSRSLGYGEADIEALVRVARTRDHADRIIGALRRLWVRRRRVA